MTWLAFVGVFALLWIHQSVGDSGMVMESALLDKLLSGYNKLVRPRGDNGSTLDVELGFYILHINTKGKLKQSPKNTAVELDGYFYMAWKDSRLSWDPSDYNTHKARLPTDKIWFPDIVQFDDPGNNLFNGQSNIAVVAQSNGSIWYMPPAALRANCKYTQGSTYACELKFGSWTYDSSGINMSASTVSGSYFNDVNPYWRYADGRAEAHLTSYSCCPEFYSDVTFYINLERK